MTSPPSVTEVSSSRLTDVGGLTVHRALPTRGRRTVGAWCFLDRFGPVAVDPERTATIGPHPHIGLHTVTWLLEGEMLHTDSLGSEQLIRPGQLNLMTAGNGIAHAEDARHLRSGRMNGVQFWVAQPEATRHGAPSFAHHGDLPHVDLRNGHATVLLGSFDGVQSPAQLDSNLVGIDVTAHGPLDLPLNPQFEYAIAALHGSLRCEGATLSTDEFMYLGAEREQIHLDLTQEARILVLGGVPFEADIVMWWNFVARDRKEMETAKADWDAGSERFGPVATTLPRIEAPHPFWLI
ncbi:MAG TPA: pirin family protein [Acidimicrobiales bacterium]|nr:pirin family protein [Acidimicrobiales bacterium]